MREAGFIDVEIRAVTSPLRLGSLEELVRFDHDIFGDIISDESTETQTAAWQEVAQASGDYVTPGSAGAPCELLVAVARRPPIGGKAADATAGSAPLVP